MAKRWQGPALGEDNAAVDRHPVLEPGQGKVRPPAEPLDDRLENFFDLEARAPLGIAVAGGMLFSTILTFLVVPATYVAIEKARARRGALHAAADGA